MTKLQSSLQHGQATCHRCRGTNHFATECRFKDAICRKCNKRGHIARACLSTAQAPRQQTGATRKLPGQQSTSRCTHQIVVNTENTDGTTDSTDSYEMFNLSGTQGKPYSGAQ